MKRFFIFIFVLFLSIMQDTSAYAYDIEITKYNINVNVKTDKTLSIQEDITAKFNVPKHGIFRTIPTRGMVASKDGTKKYSAKISNLDVSNHAYSTSSFSNNQGSFRKIKIGQPEVLVNGYQNYKIKYDYKFSGGSTKNSDELYFNLVGSQWEIPISNFTFSITMPKDFDKNQLWFYDKNGDSKVVSYKINGNTISGSYNATLHPGEPFTIHLKLPENYYEKSFFDTYYNYFPFLLLIIPPVCLISIIFMWLKYGKDKKTVTIVEFNPPDGLGPLEIAYIYKHNISNEDIATLLIHLANKGYLTIEEKNEGIFKKDYVISKLKEYDGGFKNEREFFNSLFANNRESIKILDSVYKLKLYKITSGIISRTKEKCDKFLFDKQSLFMQKIALFLMFATWSSVTCFIFAFMRLGFSLGAILLLIILPFIVYMALSDQITKKDRESIIAGVISFILFAGLVYAFTQQIMVFSSKPLCMNITLVVTCLLIIVMDIFRHNMTRWTMDGNYLYGRVLGFRDYIKKVEANKLQRLVNKNPNYFYSIIPYAYVFGIENKWFDKFKHITCEPPKYYTGNHFSIVSFSNTISNSINALSRASVPPRGNGGGGGFGGGGFGGGGGGGW